MVEEALALLRVTNLLGLLRQLLRAPWSPRPTARGQQATCMPSGSHQHSSSGGGPWCPARARGHVLAANVAGGGVRAKQQTRPGSRAKRVFFARSRYFVVAEFPAADTGLHAGRAAPSSFGEQGKYRPGPETGNRPGPPPVPSNSSVVHPFSTDPVAPQTARRPTRARPCAVLTFFLPLRQPVMPRPIAGGRVGHGAGNHVCRPQAASIRPRWVVPAMIRDYEGGTSPVKDFQACLPCLAKKSAGFSSAITRCRGLLPVSFGDGLRRIAFCHQRADSRRRAQRALDHRNPRLASRPPRPARPDKHRRPGPIFPAPARRRVPLMSF